MTNQEMAEVLLAHADGAEIEMKRREGGRKQVGGWKRATSPIWNFASFDYRVSTRVKTLVGQTLWANRYMSENYENYGDGSCVWRLYATQEQADAESADSRISRTKLLVVEEDMV